MVLRQRAGAAESRNELYRSRVKAAARGRVDALDAANRPTMVDVGGKAVSGDCPRRSADKVPHVARALSAVATARRKEPSRPHRPRGWRQAPHELIPFCHPLPLQGVTIDISTRPGGLLVVCTASVEHRTGVEMEALTGATVAALTIYDMCKALSHDIQIGPVRLLGKTGGKRTFRRKVRA